MKYIIINDWQNYLWLNFNTRQRLEKLYGAPCSLWTGFRPVNPRDRRYGNAQNVSVYTEPLEAWLQENSIRYYVSEE